MPQTDEKGQLSTDTECSVDDIKKLLAEIHERIGPDKRIVLDASQLEVVKKGCAASLYGNRCARDWKLRRIT